MVLLFPLLLDDDNIFPVLLLFPCMGEVANFLSKPVGDRGAPSVVLMLTLIGRDKASCFGGILSGGPIGLSSRFLFFFLSTLFRSSERFVEELEELLDFLSPLLLAALLVLPTLLQLLPLFIVGD